MNIGGTGAIADNNLSVAGNVTVGGTVDGRDIATDGTKLDGIEALADVTDATNVNTAGAVMNSDVSTASMSFVIDEDAMGSNSATKVPTQQSVKAYVDNSYSQMMPYFKVYQTEDSGQTGILNATTTTLVWTEEDVDSEADFASNKFTPSVAGWYTLTAGAKIEPTNVSDGDWIMLSIAKNGTGTRSQVATFTGTSANFAPLQVSDMVYANGTTDYFEVKMYQNTGSSADIYMSGSTSYRHTYFYGYGLGN